jgi:hypothetical protein
MKKNMHPTPDQKQWLKDNYKLYTNANLADKLGIPEHRLTLWLRLMGLKKRRSDRKFIVKPVYKKRNVTPVPETTIKRPKPDHTNISREQHVERILNMTL